MYLEGRQTHIRQESVAPRGRQGIVSRVPSLPREAYTATCQLSGSVSIHRNEPGCNDLYFLISCEYSLH
ncbi:hypothetical protein J4Q44_G00279890 [Coregonus suidteri]|uniref:Uncharacterized protein n=1 Tax=Coregonus suidteri TaxID=861788 RepID=A0AAN8LJD4_9TELE